MGVPGSVIFFPFFFIKSSCRSSEPFSFSDEKLVLVVCFACRGRAICSSEMMDLKLMLALYWVWIYLITPQSPDVIF